MLTRLNARSPASDQQYYSAEAVSYQYGCRDSHLERRFQTSWALQKVAHDRAVLIFFILLVLGIEGTDFAFGRTVQVLLTAPQSYRAP